MEQLKQYLDTYLFKDQEYKLVRGLKLLNIKEAQNKLAKIVSQLSMGPITVRPMANGLLIHVDSTDNIDTAVRLTQGGQVKSKESFLDQMSLALNNHIQWDEPEKREANKGYFSLILHTIEDTDIYEQIIAAYECQEEAKKNLEDTDSDFRNWVTGIWEEAHRVAKEWYTEDNIKPGTRIEVLNLKRYTSQVKPVWKITKSKAGTKIVFKDNTRIDFGGPRIGKTGTWVLSHPEYKPLLDYLREVEDTIEKHRGSSATFY